MNKPTAILTGDSHLRDTRPVSRCDDYWKAQWHKVEFLGELQSEYNCPILDAGDILDKWNCSPYLLNTCLAKLPPITTIPGNHDLPHHNLDELNKSGLSVLQYYKTRVLQDRWVELEGFHAYGQSYHHQSSNIDMCDIHRDWPTVLLTHEMVWHKDPPYPGLDSKTNALTILKKYPDFNLIVSGHNHQAFVVEHEGRLLVNPGSMMRMSADQKDFKPRCYLWYEQTNTVEPVYYPIEEDVFDLQHLELKKAQNEKIENFTNKLTIKDEDIDLDYKQNVLNYLETNRVRNQTKEIITDVINRR